MKILLAMNLPYFPVFGGANKNNRYLVEALAQKGHAVRAVVPALGTPSRLTHEEFLSELMAQAIAVASTAVIDSFRLHGVEVHAVVDPAHLRAHLLSQIQDFEPDWIFVASEEPAQNLLEVTVTANPSRVVYLAQTPSFFPFGPQAFYPSPQRTKLFEQARAIVASSKFIADYIRQWSNLDPTVIYMPVYGSGPFPHFGRFDEGFVTMVNPCRLKGISIFLALARALPEVPFAAVPTWGTTDADLVVLQGLPNVQLLEPRHDFDQILSKTRVLLMPSLWLENFPLTVIEAMLRGIPVVSSNVGGIPEVKLGTDFVLPVRPIERFLDRLDQNMLPVPVVPEQDIAPWYDTLRRLLSDRALYERQSAAARHAALQFVSGLSVAPLEELLLRLGSRPGAAQALAKPRQPDSGGTTAKQDSNFARAAGLSAEQRALLMLRLWKKANQRVEQESAVPTITRAAREAPLPLSYAQQRLWFLQQLQPTSPAYALPLALRLDGPLDLAALRHSFTVLVARHEILRTTFPLYADQPVQQIAPPRPVPLPLIDLQALPPTARRPSADTLTAADARRPFDLAHGPLLRVFLLRLAPDLHILMLNLHHIITDGWSLGLLVREVLTLYAAACDQRRPDLPDLPIQYADYAVWQRAWLQGSGVRGQGSARQGDKETRRQGDREQEESDSQSPIPNPQSPISDPSPPPALRLSPVESQLAYWKTQLAELPALELPTDYPRGPEPTFAGDSHALALPKALNAALNVLSQREGTTLFMTMLAAWLVLLHRYSGQADLAVGTSIANRTHAATERLIGFFVNTLVLRADLSGNLSFRALLARIRQVCLDAYAHQDLPFERLVEALTPARDPSRHPLFDVLFELQPATLAPLELSELRVRPQAVANQTAKFDLSLALDETPEGLIGAFEYRTDLFASATIARMAVHFQTLLEGIVAQPEQRLADLPLLPDAERNRVLAEFNATGASFRLDRFTHQVFEDRAAQTPDALAALYGAEQITYATLNRRANQLAHWLCRQRLGYSAHVGVLGSRGIDMLTVLLATLKAGCVYVPLDPAHPDARLTSILADSGIRLIATQAALLDRACTLIDSLAAPPLVFCWDAAPTLHARPGDRAWADQSGTNIPGTPDPRDLANIFYTSGSTGVPKGAMVEQIGMLNHLWAKIDRLGLDARSSVAQTASHCFDISIWQFLAPLLAGGRVVIYDDDTVLDPLRFLQAIQRDHITVVETVPTHLTALLETIATLPHGAKEITLPALTYLISNAETLPVPLCRQWLERFPHVPLINTYGATECSDDTTHYLLRTLPAEHAHRVPVGSPIPGFKIYVLDSQLRPLPIGCIGQIAMAGVGVGRGYLGDPSKTARVFVPNPFAEGMGDGGWGMEDAPPSPIPHPPSPGTRLYLTGDQGRWGDDGLLEFIGRMDGQVKVRGHRVELGEIEAALAEYPGMRQVVVLAREDQPGEVRLVAYVVPKIEDRGLKIEDSGSDAPDPLSSILYPLSSELRDFLKDKLPDYMVPSAFVPLEALPLNRNGKIDRRALPAPDSRTILYEDTYVAPRTPVEELLAQVWAAVLGAARVGVHDNFFDLGGHSLLATQVVSRIREAFGVELPLRSLFEAPTVAGLAQQVMALQGSAALPAPPILPVPRDTPLPLSYAQQRLWFLQQLLPDSALYSLPMALQLLGPLDLPALQRSLTEIMRRHEALRTTFAMVDDQPVQLIAPAAPFPLPLLDLRALPTDSIETEALRLAAAESQQPFDLVRGPLIRARLLRMAPSDHVLLLNMHHIVSDGWSIGVLIREMTVLYHASSRGQPATLPDLSIQYADYAVWQRHWLQGSGVRGQESGVRSQGATAPLPPPAGGGTEGGRSQESDIDERSTQNSKLKTQNSPPPPSPIEAQLAYWRQQLADLPTVELPTDKPRPPVSTFQGASQDFALPAALSDDLAALSRREGATLFMTLLAVWQILLARYSGQDGIVVGTPIANRTRGEIEGLIGFFVNTLVLRAELPDMLTFRAALKQVRKVCLDAYAHQDLPFEQVVEVLAPGRDTSRHPLFQVMFALQNAPLAPLDLPGLSIRPMAIAGQMAKFDLSLVLAATPGGLVGTFEYRTDLFDPATISRMHGHYRTLLEAIVARPDQRLVDLPLLTAAEHAQLAGWNATRTGVRSQESGVRSEAPDSWPSASDSFCTHHLVEAQAARRPDAVAVIFDGGRGSGVGGQESGVRSQESGVRSQESDVGTSQTQNSKLKTQNFSPILHPQSLTYAELNVRANRLAHHLRTLGVGPEVPVGLCMERSPELVVGLLGILKAGGVFLPLDPALPAERLAFMLEDARARVVLTLQHIYDLRFTIHDLPAELKTQNSKLKTPVVVCLDAVWEQLAHQPAQPPVTELTAANLAYLIYTSGTTGRPKAVMVEHRTLINTCCASQQQVAFTAQDVMPWIASAAFDIALFEILNPLLAGGTVLVLPQHQILDLPQLVRDLADVTVFHAVPGLMRQIVETINVLMPDIQLYDRMRAVFIGGDRVPAELPAQVQSVFRRAQIYLQYGPTEGTIICTRYLVPHDQLQGYLIGTPLPNTQAWVLDRRRRLAPIGTPGELYLGGAGLARGYLHRPELTAERFVPNPFAEVLGDGCWVLEDSAPNTQHLTPNTRLYRTGDLVRYRPDGTLEFLGRTDEQVKIRGFRIEPGEIEAALGQHPAVQACAVVAREDHPGEVRLVAYLVTSDKSRVTSEGGDALVTRYSLLVTQLRAFLQQKLPEYMLPAAFVPLEVLPLTRNGKLDRRALPAPEQSGTTFQETYIAPRDTLEFQLTRIWEELLGVRPIGVSVNFFDLGGHSLLAVSLMAQIQRQFARDLPLSALFQGPTIEQLAYLLQQDSASLRWSPVVPIQTGGAKPPFFCVHPAGGQVLCYVDLARHLGPDHPFYGIQARGLYGEQLPYTHIEDMAEHYIAAMRVVQPHGPYFLGGWSFGSVVAFEIAQQLQRQGQEVGLLVMLDSEAPIPDAEADPRDDAAIDAEMLADMIGKENLPMSYDAFLRLDPHEQMNCLLERARKAKAIPLGIGAPEVRRFLRLRKAHAQALTSYTPHVYPNRITLFKAESPMESMDTPRPTVGVGPTDITLGWSALSCLPITVCTAPGTHATMLNEPHVRVLADLLRVYLDASQSTGLH